MQYRILKVLLFIFFTTHLAHAQKALSFWTELGINSSGVIFKHPDNVRSYGTGKETDFPILSPVLGVCSKLKFGRSYFFTMGFQYFKFGNKKHTYGGSSSLYTSEFGSSTSYTGWEILTFQKVCLPVSCGWDIKIGKVKTNVQLGYRVNYIISGQINSKHSNTNIENGKTTVEEREFTSDLYNKKEYLGPERWTLGTFAGIGVDFGRRLNIGFTVSCNQGIHYSEKGSCIGYSYNNQDFTLAARYLVKKKEWIKRHP